MRILFIAFVAILLIGMQAFCQTENKWNLKKDKNDIKVYTCKAEDSDIIEVKVLTSVQATVNQVSTLLADVETYAKWMPNVKSTRIIEQISKDEMYYYIEMNAPWPISNRDNIILYKYTQDQESGVVRIFVNGNPDYLPENDGIVRIIQSNGLWQLTPKPNGKTEIVSTYQSNPSGSFPGWVVKMFVVGGIYDTFVNLKKLVTDKK